MHCSSTSEFQMSRAEEASRMVESEKLWDSPDRAVDGTFQRSHRNARGSIRLCRESRNSFSQDRQSCCVLCYDKVAQLRPCRAMVDKMLMGGSKVAGKLTLHGGTVDYFRRSFCLLPEKGVTPGNHLLQRVHHEILNLILFSAHK